MKYLIAFLLLALIALHQDYWQWNDATLDFGFLPRSLTYHVALSIAASVVWLLAVQFCWPQNLEDAALDAAPDDAAEARP